MARTLRSDRWLFVATLVLVAASVVMVYSASAVQATGKGLSPYHFLTRQLAWAVIGFALLLVAMRVDYHQYRRPALIWTLLGIVVVLLLGVFLRPPVNGTQRWLAVHGFSMQPSELAKIAAIFFTAALLERRMHRVNDPSDTLLPIGIVTLGLAALIVKEPDFGTAVVLTLVVTAIVFTAGLKYRYLFGTLSLFALAGIALVITEPYRFKRLLVFLDPAKDAWGDGFQILQSFIAVGSGGVFGKGLMAGVQKLFYIPEPHTDFIYAVIAEELGLIGSTLILICFGVIAWRGLRASLLAPDRFGALLALGLTTMVALQALVNISVVVGLVPTKGIPLPFVSNGGSSLVINLMAMGILLNISQQASPTAVAVAARGDE